MWLYQGSEFTSEMIGDKIGFVYLITEISTDMKYIGKKNFWVIRKLKPLKGQKRKRIIKEESDWKQYYGSSTKVQDLLLEHGTSHFKREILHLCTAKGQMSYLEAKEQFDREVLLRPDYYNGIISCRINRTHVSVLSS